MHTLLIGVKPEHAARLSLPPGIRTWGFGEGLRRLEGLAQNAHKIVVFTGSAGHGDVSRAKCKAPSTCIVEYRNGRGLSSVKTYLNEQINGACPRPYQVIE